MKIKSVLVTAGLFLTLLGIFPAGVNAAASLRLDPDVTKAQKNKTFTVTIHIDTENEQVFGSDVTLLYPHNDLELTNVAKGDFFRDFQYANTGNGRLELHGFFSSLYETKSGNGTYATLTFRSKPTSGGGSVSFICNGSGSDTQIINGQGQNILSCSVLNRLDITYLPEITGTPTPTPTGTAQNRDPLCASLVVNPVSSTYVPVDVTLTCTGRDDDGDITAAEFIFGDGHSIVISKNVGSPGSISTNHRYAGSGSLTATCRLRDNRDRYSSANDSCRKSISLIPAATGTATPTPTTQIVMLSVTQTPTPAPYTPDTPTPSPVPVPENSDYSQAWWLLGVVWIVALILAYVYYRKRRRPRGPVLLSKD